MAALEFSASPASSFFADALERDAIRSAILAELTEMPPKYYVLGDVLRRTLQGNVTKAVCTRTSLPVVLKTCGIGLAVRRRSCSGKRVLEDVFQELKILKDLQSKPHDNVVKLYDAFADKSSVYLALEWCGKGELYDYIEKEGPMSETLAKSYFTQIARGVAHLHSLHIVHLDLSLENVFISDSGVPKIGDFGLAREFKESDEFQASPSNRPGKISYMAPEIFLEKKFSGKKADVFSLGVVLFSLVYGFPPFEVPSPDDDLRYRLIASGRLGELLEQWSLSGRISREGENLIQKMLLEEKDRPSLEEVMEHPWISKI